MARVPALEPRVVSPERRFKARHLLLVPPTPSLKDPLRDAAVERTELLEPLQRDVKATHDDAAASEQLQVPRRVDAELDVGDADAVHRDCVLRSVGQHLLEVGAELSRPNRR